MSDRAVRVLLTNECWQLLRDQEVGRLAVIVGERPEIFPVNFVVDHGSIVFRTGEGSKLAALVHQSNVAFEVDGSIDGDAFSVIVKGRGQEIGNRDELFDVVGLPLFPWNSAPKHHFVRIEPDMVTGRRFSIEDRRSQHADDPPPLRRAPSE